MATAPAWARDFLTARALLVVGDEPDRAAELLAQVAALEHDPVGLVARLLLAAIDGENGATHRARQRLLDLFRVAGWPVPEPGEFHGNSGGSAGIRARLASGAPLIIDRLLGLRRCGRAADAVDRLDRHGLLHGGAFYRASDEHDGVCDKRRANVDELRLRHDLELGELTAVEAALARIVAANNFFEGSHYLPLESQIASYPGAGGRYALHTDAARGGCAGRRVTLLYYLTPGWRPPDGGLLRIQTPTGTQVIEPRADRAVIFASHWPHEVTSCHRRRRSFTSWCWSTAV